METVTVAASRVYPVHIGGGLLDRCGELTAAATAAGRCLVVSDDTVAPLYGARVLASLEAAGLRASLYTFPAGEQSKNLTTYGKLLEHMAREKLTRSDCVAALGGGVTGDMAGFAAATYQRGIDYIQIPTTFLAAADSSVGGKTAVDLEAGKNLVGAFWQPRAVICDTDTFRTLPEDTFLDGVAETVKHGLIADADFFRFLLAADLRGDIDRIVRRDVEIKAAVVGEDEFERGRRKILNFGHTLGHAMEKLSGYATPHGHAVAMGMVVVARAAYALGLSHQNCTPALLEALDACHLPTACPYDGEQLAQAALQDKKRRGSQITLVVPNSIGYCYRHTIPVEELRSFIGAGLGAE